MRYYLDTNILVFLWTGDSDSVDNDTRAIINDYANTLLTSSVCVVEFTHLLHIGKIKPSYGRKDGIHVPNVVAWLGGMGIDIVHTTAQHLRQFNTLPLHTKEHRDPFDRFIIAQAIADRIPLISSDRKFSLYTNDGLDLILNKR